MSCIDANVFPKQVELTNKEQFNYLAIIFRFSMRSG
jgi:hypothetical protein